MDFWYWDGGEAGFGLRFCVLMLISGLEVVVKLLLIPGVS
jgi:hypothetical protein